MRSCLRHLPVARDAAGGIPTAPARAVGILPLIAAALTLSCTEVLVSAVDVAHVEIEPHSLSLMVGDSARMNARLVDAAGNELGGRTISWSSGTPEVAAIDAEGRVRALAPGSAAITATSEGARDEVMVAIAARPALVLDPVSVTLTARAGGPPPPTATVLVAANATATELSLSTGYAPGQPVGWLVASLTGSSTPAILTLNVSTAGLAAGTYDATVTVDARDASSARVVPVTLIVQQQQPEIGLSMIAAAFDATQNGVDPPAQTVAVTNDGGGSLDGLRIAIAYTAGQPTGWLRASLTGTTAPSTLTLEPATGALAAGSYAATVLVSSDAATNSPRAIDVTFDVDPAPPAILIAPSTVIMSGTAGGPDPAPATAVISERRWRAADRPPHDRHPCARGADRLAGRFPAVDRGTGDPDAHREHLHASGRVVHRVCRSRRGRCVDRTVDSDGSRQLERAGPGTGNRRLPGGRHRVGCRGGSGSCPGGHRHNERRRRHARRTLTRDRLRRGPADRVAQCPPRWRRGADEHHGTGHDRDARGGHLRGDH